MNIIFILIIIFIVANISIIIWHKMRVTEAIDLLEESIRWYEKLARVYLENENTLKKLECNLHILGVEQRIELANVFSECVETGNQCYALAKTIKELYEEAVTKLDAQRMYHNLFGGGANDLAAFLYYSSEKRLRELVKRIQFIQPDEELIKRVNTYIKENVLSKK